MNYGLLAIFTRLNEQSFDSALELDSEGAILSKTSPAPERRLDSGALLNCVRRTVLWSVEVNAACGALNPSVMSNPVWAESRHSNWSITG